MTRRGWAVAILGAWAVSLGWLVKRTYFQSTAARLADAALAVPPGATFYLIRLGGQQIGYAATTIDQSLNRLGILRIGKDAVLRPRCE